MLNFALRRIQRWVLQIKIGLLLGSIALLINLVVNTSPSLVNIVLASLVVFLAFSVAVSFFSPVATSLLVGGSVGFFLFLKAVSLLSPINAGLFLIFLLLVGLYLRKG